jgi:L,D-transpeptidase ErfK/SrfK
VQAFPVMEDDPREHPKAADKLLNAAITDDMWKNVKEHGAAIDLEVVNGLMAQPRGIALPVSKPKMTIDTYVAGARHVENRVPPGANWNGSEEMYYTAEEFEAARNGTPMPLKKPAPKAVKKSATKPATAANGTGASAGSR